MSVAVWIVAPDTSPIHAWLDGFARAESIGEARLAICEPPGVVGRGRSEIPLVACLPLGPHEDLVAASAFDHVAVHADAYATTERDLHEAIAFALEEDRSARERGPLRLTWLGALGQIAPSRVGPIGRGYPLAGSTLVGRATECAIVLRTGAHSDQNTVARRHALIVLGESELRVRDLGSTNGTWVDGRSIRDEAIAPGSELGIAGTLRFRLDGAPPRR